MAITDKVVAAPASVTPGVKERIDKQNARIAELESKAAEADTLRAQLAVQGRQLALQQFVFTHNLSPDAMDPEVIEDIGRRFDRRVQTLGAEKAGSFEDYLGVVKEAPPVTLRSVFVSREAAQPVAAAQPAAGQQAAPPAAAPPRVAPNVNAGALPRSGPPPAAAYTDAVLATMTPAEIRADLAAIRAEAVAAGEIAPSPAK